VTASQPEIRQSGGPAKATEAAAASVSQRGASPKTQNCMIEISVPKAYSLGKYGLPKYLAPLWIRVQLLSPGIPFGFRNIDHDGVGIVELLLDGKVIEVQEFEELVNPPTWMHSNLNTQIDMMSSAADKIVEMWNKRHEGSIYDMMSRISGDCKHENKSFGGEIEGLHPNIEMWACRDCLTLGESRLFAPPHPIDDDYDMFYKKGSQRQRDELDKMAAKKHE